MTIKPSKETADLILFNGKIVTMDTEDTATEGIAIGQGKIIELGTNETVKRFAADNTRLIDLNGRLVTPGLIDSHGHFAEAGMDAVFILDLRYPNTKSIADILSLIAKKAKQSEKGSWILGSGWNEGLLAEKRCPTRWELDPVSQDYPVVIRHVTGHCLVANSAALKLAGISKTTQQPPAGEIEKDNTGEPTGLLKEFSAMNKVLDLIPEWTTEQWMEGIRHATKEWISEGVTAVKESYSRIDYDRIIAAYRKLMSSNEMIIRSFVLCSAENTANVKYAVEHPNDFLAHTADTLLRLGGIKVIFDGSLVAKTAWMYEDYCNDSGEIGRENRGYSALSVDTLNEIVQAAHANGFQIAIHAIGDRAIDAVLDAYGKALKTNPKHDHRHSIVHALVPRPDAVKRIRDLNVVIETQASFLYFLSDGYARAIGNKRLKHVIPLRTLLDAGITVGNGSDAPYSPHPPRYGLWAACTRRSLSGREGDEFLGKEECINIKEALRSYTIDAAKCLKMENEIGSLERRKRADLVVWERDMLSIPIDDVNKLQVIMTIVGGKVEFQRQPLDA